MVIAVLPCNGGIIPQSIHVVVPEIGKYYVKTRDRMFSKMTWISGDGVLIKVRNEFTMGSQQTKGPCQQHGPFCLLIFHFDLPLSHKYISM
jgi:hypothetical protein